jgi:membrane-bound serine protease (ClpP class)
VALVIALAVAGIILIIAEVFLPGGVLGFLGFCCIGGAIYFAFRRYEMAGLVISAVVLISIAILAWLTALKVLPRTSVGKDLFLTKTQKGYHTRKDELEQLVGRLGVAESALRPTGKVEIDGDRYDAVSEGEFLGPGSRIVVTGIRSNQLLVEEASGTEES